MRDVTASRTARFEILRLAYHYHVPAWRRPDGRVLTSSTEGRFLDSLASHCEQLVCFLHEPRDEERRGLDYVFDSPNLRWVSFGRHASTPERTLFPWRFTQPLTRWRDRLDALLLRGPSPLLPATARQAAGLPIAMLLVGDYEAVVNDLPQPALRKAAIRYWAGWNRRGQQAVGRDALTLVNSEELYQRWNPALPHVVSVRTTNLRCADFQVREDTCESRPYRLLYAGRMDRGKGLLVMVDAVAQLVERGENVLLDLVGPEQPGDPILAEVASLAADLGIRERIVYHGSRPIGLELYAFHRRADVFVQASLQTEGFPRAIWEGLANSLPVVATSVGGIPLVLKDRETARLVEPRSAPALAKGIGDVISGRVLRRRLIRNGRRLAESNTLERRTREMADLLRDWGRATKHGI